MFLATIQSIVAILVRVYGFIETSKPTFPKLSVSNLDSRPELCAKGPACSRDQETYLRRSSALFCVAENVSQPMSPSHALVKLEHFQASQTNVVLQQHVPRRNPSQQKTKCSNSWFGSATSRTREK